MGALTTIRKREEESFVSFPNLIEPSYGHIAKKPRLSVPMNHKTPDCSRPPLSSSVVSRIYRYPPAKNSGFPRIPHAPIRNTKFGRSSFDKGIEATPVSRDSQADKMGKFSFFHQAYTRAKDSAKKTLRYVFNRDDDSIEEVENLRSVGNVRREKQGPIESSGELNARKVKKEVCSLDSSVVRDVSNAKVDGGVKAQLSLLDQESDDSGVPRYKRMMSELWKRDSKLSNLEFNIELEEKRLQGYQLSKPQKKKEDVAKECFLPLTEDEKSLVSQSLSNANRRKIVASHERSNLDITGEKLQCLKPGAWLNDEVINLYLELLKEREKREPGNFLTCHFFNTFFYKKLISGGYNFSSVRRWTTQRKLGYSLLECDKIFVPIHKEVHWCLAVINKKDEKFQYLDSLGGTDERVLNVLARYFVDEVKDKCGKDIDVDSWEREFVTELPEQKNGYDCGMFMIKYADFYSRGIGLCFCQDHMKYFRQRTAKEILKLRAE
ncbi:hypothetical protein ACS0TY_027878 [Phlomoides rotata]